ncbi:MAG: hypothetical protein V9F04_10095 [Dermatophilaceae bacterium]
MTQSPQWQQDWQPGPPQPPAHPAATGWLRLHLQGSQWANLVVPTVRINGHAIPVTYGANDLQVWAGVNDLHIHCQWAWQYGVAQERLEVPAGGVVERHYAMPWMTFFPGSLGHVPQKRRGLGCFVTLFAVPALVILAITVLGALSSGR